MKRLLQKYYKCYEKLNKRDADVPGFLADLVQKK